MAGRQFLSHRVLALVMLLTSLPAVASAAQATPIPVPVERVDLAAMALASEDVPSGFFDDYGEWWVPAAVASDFVFGGAPAPNGLVQVYQSFYLNDDQATAIHNYLFQYASPQEAAAGIVSVDAALRPPLPEGTVEGPTNAPGPVIGDGPSKTTRVTYDTRAADGPLVDVFATTFSRDSIVAGVSVEQFSDGFSIATPAASPVEAAPSDLSANLSRMLDVRIATVLEGGESAGVDPTLSNLTLPLGRLVEDPTPVFGGYKSGIDLLRCGICGETNSLIPYADDVLGGFNRSMVAGPVVDGEPQPPFISVTLFRFNSPEVATETLDAMQTAPNDRPTPYPVPRGQRASVEAPAIPGSSDVAASEGILPDDPTAPVDSAAVLFVTDAWLVAVDVQGGLPGADALALATDLATQQAACLAEGSCDEIVIPPVLQDVRAAQ